MPYYTVPPRPILKRPSPLPSPAASPNTHPVLPNHAVHFPPSPSLTRIFSAYSAAAYDRSPIVIAPNTCTLPERGCPGRTYYSVDDYSRGSNTKHPRAFSNDNTASSTSSCVPCPPLIPDLSSESEESDGFASGPPFLVPHPFTYNSDGLAVNITRHQEDSCYSVATTSTTTLDAATALAFLPYPPSPLVRSSPRLVDDDEGGLIVLPPSPTPSKPRRRRSSRERKYERDSDSRTRNDLNYTGDIRRKSRTTTTAMSSCRTKSSDTSLSICTSSFSSFGLQDDGCLGGF